MNPIQLALRGFQFLMVLLIMSLIGNMLSISSGPSVINYDMFVAVICMLALFYLIAQSVNDSFTVHSALPLALDGICAVATFIGGVATAAYLHVHSCGNIVSHAACAPCVAGANLACRNT